MKCHRPAMIAQRICENTIFWLKQRFLSILKLLSRLRTGKWSETIYCSQRTQRLYLDWCLFFTLKYFCGTASCVCVVFVFVFVKDRKVVEDNLWLAKKTRTVWRAKSSIATTNSWPNGETTKISSDIDNISTELMLLKEVKYN